MVAERRHVALIGMAGVGKTSVGRRVARALHSEWVDLDSSIEQRTGRTVEELFAGVGERGFRSAETDDLADLFGEVKPQVVSTGGGAVLSARNADLLRHGAFTVWLRASDETLVARLKRSNKVRPLIAGDVAGNVARLNRERADAYKRCADAVVDVDDLKIDEVVRRVVAEIPSIADAPAPAP